MYVGLAIYGRSTHCKMVDGGVQMIKTSGYVIGSALLLEGVLLFLQPRLLFRLWENKLRPYCPEPANIVVTDFFNMSDRTIRYSGLWFAVLGGLALGLASRARK